MGEYLPRMDPGRIKEAGKDPTGRELYELLTQPLVEELYRQGDFQFLNRIHPGQAVFLAYEYVRGQVLPGGFIQCIQNGYVPLIALLAEQMPALGISEMGALLDQVLIWYLRHRDELEKDGGLGYFAGLYGRFPQTREWDSRFSQIDARTIGLLARYATENLSQFCRIEDPGSP